MVPLSQRQDTVGPMARYVKPLEIVMYIHLNPN